MLEQGKERVLKEFVLRMSGETFELISEGVKMIKGMARATEDQVRQYLLKETLDDLRTNHALSKPGSGLTAEMTTQKDIVLVLKFSDKDWNEILQGTKARYSFGSNWNENDLEDFLLDSICTCWNYHYISYPEESAREINERNRTADEERQSTKRKD